MKKRKTFALKYNVGKNIYFRCYNCGERLKDEDDICPGCNSPIEAVPIFTPVKEKSKKEHDLISVVKQEPKQETITVDEEVNLIKKLKAQKVSIEFETTPEEEIAASAEFVGTSPKKKRRVIRTAFSILTSITVIVISVIVIPHIFNFAILPEINWPFPSDSEEIIHALQLETSDFQENSENHHASHFETTNNTNIEHLENLDFYQLELHIESFMAQFGDTVSVYFENFESSFVFHHNPYKTYFASNISALPFAYYIWQKSSAGQNSIRETITFEERDRQAGTGVIQHSYAVGTDLTQKRLLETMIQNSDNIAIAMLRRYHGVNTYTAFIEEIGANASFINTITYSYIDAFNAGFFARHIFAFLQAGYYYSAYFREDLLNHNHSFANFTYPAASKTAWAPDAMHEIAIVYAPSPFSLSILSSRIGNSVDRRVFAEISEFFEQFNQIFYGG